MKLINEIKSQPAHIREVFMWLCVVITFSMVSFFWFQSTAREFVAMVNPQKSAEDRAFAQTSPEQPSILATIGQSAGTLKDGLAQILGFTKNSTIEFTGTYKSDPVPPQLFPVTQNK